VIERPPGWLSILRDERVLSEYDEMESAALSAMLRDPVPFVVEWNGNDMLEALLSAVPPEGDAIVDNDHGVLAPILAVRSLPIGAWVTASELP